MSYAPDVYDHRRDDDHLREAVEWEETGLHCVGSILTRTAE